LAFFLLSPSAELTISRSPRRVVNFNLALSSFEPHILGALNLLHLCFSSPYGAAFYFASSVSAVAAWRGPGPVPEVVTEDPTFAQGMGYAHSKWVTERLCKVVSETSTVRAVVLRKLAASLGCGYDSLNAFT
jgi:nucleoside-diphosphate-sugar epimerase